MEHIPVIAVMSATRQLMPNYAVHTIPSALIQLRYRYLLSSLTHSECGHLQSTYFLALYIHPNISTISVYYDAVSI